ncbi:MAG TPA: carboxypeptidase-like regulatory domain-containing protein [Flavisolibacter sp.]|jgi:hypothetical protein|nr:carboxypeptidase-like regulatory domain-containing protein [Flavisolibacter sp.]
MRSLFLLLTVLLFQAGKAQKLLRGVVLDAEKASPVPKASVFLNNMSVGTTANEQGRFELLIPAGKYELIVSSVGYVTSIQTIAASEVADFVTVKLIPKVPELEAIVIEPYEKNGWEKWGRFFLENFIGTSALAADCRILNKDVIRFRHSKAANKLTAHAMEPLVIENKALGYRLRYQLETFEYNFQNHYILYIGYPFFELMEGREKKQKAWQQKRSEIYYGSMMHFMRSIYRNTLPQEGFEVRRMKKIPNLEKQRVKEAYKSNVIKSSTTGNRIMVGAVPSDSMDYYETVLRQPDFHDVIGKEVLVGDSIAFGIDSLTAGLSFPDYLYVRYKNGKVPKEYVQRYPSGAHAMLSYLQLLNNQLVAIQSNGMFYNPIDIISSGYWAWSEKIATMLPFDFKPSQ